MNQPKYNAPRPRRGENQKTQTLPKTNPDVQIPLRTKKAEPDLTALKKQSKNSKKPKGDFVKPYDIVRVRGGVDRPMLVIIVLLLCFGSVMVFSASYAYASYKHDDSLYFIKRQLGFAAFGLLCMFGLTYWSDYRWYQKASWPLYIGTCILLFFTLVYGIASGVAKRWIIIGGLRFQPSELMKLVIVLVLANFFAQNQRVITDRSDFIRSSVYGMGFPMILVGIACLLIALENHYSCMIIMFLIGMSVIFVGGARKLWFILGGFAAGLVGTLAISLSSYAKERVDVFLHPENYSAQDEIWQTLQGQYAIGSGGLLGVGLGNSRQKHMFVSEPQNDFIFSIICEELGFIGALAVLTLFGLFVWRGFVIALRAPDTFSSLTAVGITSKVTIQAVLNICVVTGLLPNTGISLPFFSYGGTALIMLLCEMGVLLCISRYTYEPNLK